VFATRSKIEVLLPREESEDIFIGLPRHYPIFVRMDIFRRQEGI